MQLATLFLKGPCNAGIMIRRRFVRKAAWPSRTRVARVAATKKNLKKNFEIRARRALESSRPNALRRSVAASARSRVGLESDRACRANALSRERRAARQRTAPPRLSRLDLQATSSYDRISEQSNRGLFLRARERTVAFVLTRIRGTLLDGLGRDRHAAGRSARDRGLDRRAHPAHDPDEAGRIDLVPHHLLY